MLINIDVVNTNELCIEALGVENSFNTDINGAKGIVKLFLRGAFDNFMDSSQEFHLVMSNQHGNSIFSIKASSNSFAKPILHAGYCLYKLIEAKKDSYVGNLVFEDIINEVVDDMAKRYKVYFDPGRNKLSDIFNGSMTYVVNYYCYTYSQLATQKMHVPLAQVQPQPQTQVQPQQVNWQASTYAPPNSAQQLSSSSSQADSGLLPIEDLLGNLVDNVDNNFQKDWPVDPGQFPNSSFGHQSYNPTNEAGNIAPSTTSLANMGGTIASSRSLLNEESLRRKPKDCRKRLGGVVNRGARKVRGGRAELSNSFFNNQISAPSNPTQALSSKRRRADASNPITPNNLFSESIATTKESLRDLTWADDNAKLNNKEIETVFSKIVTMQPGKGVPDVGKITNLWNEIRDLELIDGNRKLNDEQIELVFSKIATMQSGKGVPDVGKITSLWNEIKDLELVDGNTKMNDEQIELVFSKIVTMQFRKGVPDAGKITNLWNGIKDLKLSDGKMKLNNNQIKTIFFVFSATQYKLKGFGAEEIVEEIAKLKDEFIPGKNFGINSENLEEDKFWQFKKEIGNKFKEYHENPNLENLIKDVQWIFQNAKPPGRLLAYKKELGFIKIAVIIEVIERVNEASQSKNAISQQEINLKNSSSTSLNDSGQDFSGQYLNNFLNNISGDSIGRFDDKEVLGAAMSEGSSNASSSIEHGILPSGNTSPIKSSRVIPNGADLHLEERR